MTKNDDPQGHELMNHYLGKPSFEVFERDDGFVASIVGAHEYFSDYKHWKKHEKIAIEHIEDSTCLDIGCGAGRVALFLQSRGRDVTAIDSSPLAVKVSRLRGVKKAKVMGIEEVVSFGKGRFDNILLFGIGFALLQSRSKAKKILKSFYKITRPEGTIIAESKDPYITENPVHFAYHKANIKKGRMPGQLRQRIRFLQYCSPWFDLLYASKGEVKEIIKGTGWKVAKFIDSPNFKKDGRFFAIMEKA